MNDEAPTPEEAQYLDGYAMPRHFACDKGSSVSRRRPQAIVGVDGYRNGHLLLERLAASAQGEYPPKLKLTSEQAAEVLCFITFSAPVSPKDWWKDPTDGPSRVMGFIFALDAVEECLRNIAERSARLGVAHE